MAHFSLSDMLVIIYKQRAEIACKMHNRKHKRDPVKFTHTSTRSIRSFAPPSLFCYWEIAVKFVLYMNVMLFGSLVFSDKCERFMMLPWSSSQLLNWHYPTDFSSFYIKLTHALSSHWGMYYIKYTNRVNFLYICHFFTFDMTVM